MIPATDEDRLKSKIYRELQINSPGLGYTEFGLLFRNRYEKEKYSGKPIGFKAESLEDNLFMLAHTWLNTSEKERRSVDVMALKIIKKTNRCKGNDPVAVHYFRIYQDTKKSLGDLLNGVAYIEEQAEATEDNTGVVFEENTLEGQLIKLSKKYNSAPDSKRRKVDYEALALIKRCASCRKSPGLMRYYYGFYKDQIEKS